MGRENGAHTERKCKHVGNSSRDPKWDMKLRSTKQEKPCLERFAENATSTGGEEEE
jgi:hypothetical protein